MVKKTARILYFVVVVLIQQHLCMSVCLSVRPSGPDRTRSNCFDACVNYVVTLLMYVRPSLRPDRTIVCLSVCPSGLDRTRSNCFDACVNYVVTLLMYVTCKPFEFCCSVGDSVLPILDRLWHPLMAPNAGGNGQKMWQKKRRMRQKKKQIVWHNTTND